MREETVREAINKIADPCSAGRGVRIGLTDMGLVRDVRIYEAQGCTEVEVDMRVTSPGCMFVVEFDAQIRRHLNALGADQVHVEWENETFDWSPDDIEESARQRLLGYRKRLNDAAPRNRIALTVLPVA